LVVQYKCNNCGSDMNFNPKSGQLLCESCGLSEDISSKELSDSNDKNIKYEPDKEDNQDTESFEQDFYDSHNGDIESEHNHFDGNDGLQYECNNCGAKLITDSNTTATTCSFCDAAMVLGDRLSGVLSPSLVIPFKISKADAQQAFKKWCRNGRLTPSDFMTANRIANITGLYVPYWLFDLNAKGEVQATCTKVRTYTQGDYIVTETSYYNVYRKVDLDYLKLPCDASQKMDDKIMDKLEPFHYSDLKSFNMPYLAGYISEKYDFTDSDLLPRAKKRAVNYVDNFVRSTITGYSSVKFNHKDININQRSTYYTLLPVWVVYYNHANKDYIFSMNGQTGKVVGKPPFSKGKIAAWFSGIFGLSFVIMRLLALIIQGGL